MLQGGAQWLWSQRAGIETRSARALLLGKGVGGVAVRMEHSVNQNQPREI